MAQEVERVVCVLIATNSYILMLVLEPVGLGLSATQGREDGTY